MNNKDINSVEELIKNKRLIYASTGYEMYEGQVFWGRRSIDKVNDTIIKDLKEISSTLALFLGEGYLVIKAKDEYFSLRRN